MGPSQSRCTYKVLSVTRLRCPDSPDKFLPPYWAAEFSRWICSTVPARQITGLKPIVHCWLIRDGKVTGTIWLAPYCPAPSAKLPERISLSQWQLLAPAFVPNGPSHHAALYYVPGHVPLPTSNADVGRRIFSSDFPASQARWLTQCPVRDCLPRARE